MATTTTAVRARKLVKFAKYEKFLNIVKLPLNKILGIMEQDGVSRADIDAFKYDEDSFTMCPLSASSICGPSTAADIKEGPASYAALLAACSKLPYKQPVSSNQLAAICRSKDDRKARALMHAKRTRPILHASIVDLMKDWLKAISDHGSAVEQKYYNGKEKMDEWKLLTRLLTQRPLVFFMPHDIYTLRSGENGSGGFEAIGTEREKTPLVLANLLSYDEMALSAFLGMSTPTFFINSGGRNNCGVVGKPGSYEPAGIYVAQVGTRFERKQLMAWRHLVVTAEQNTAANGYGPKSTCDNKRTAALLRVWAKFYDVSHFPLYVDVVGRVAQAEASGQPPQWVRLPRSDYGRPMYLDTKLYRRRIRLLHIIFFEEANKRAKAANKKAYCHLVGLGLGAWAVHGNVQKQIYMDAVADALRAVSATDISNVDFSWFRGCSECGKSRSGEDFTTKGGHKVRITFSTRNPAAPLRGPDSGKLLVAQYAWDGNSWPGNEYWSRRLSASGDPAAACCSTISELQNPDSNPDAFQATRAHVVPARDDGKL